MDLLTIMAAINLFQINTDVTQALVIVPYTLTSVVLSKYSPPVTSPGILTRPSQDS